MSSSRVPGSAAVVACLLLLVGCGDNPSPKVDPTTPATAAPTASAATESSPSSTQSPSPAETTSDALYPGDELSAKEFAALVRKAFGRKKTAWIRYRSMTFSGVPEGKADFRKEPPSYDLSGFIVDLGGEVDLRLVGDYVYGRSSSDSQWTRIGRDDPDSAVAEMVQQLYLPDRFANIGHGVRGPVTYLGINTFDNLSMNNYEAVVETAAIRASLPQKIQDREDLPGTVTYEVYIDGNGSLGGFVIDLGPSIRSIELTFREWGDPVSIEAPPGFDG